MSSPTTKKTDISARTPRQRFEGHTSSVRGVIHLLDGQRIITCSIDGSLRVWNLESGKQIGEDWRDGDKGVISIALSPDGKKVVSGNGDGGVRLWDIDTGKVIAKWTGHTHAVLSVCWSRDGQRVVSGYHWDGTVRQWDVENGETILAPGPIKTAHLQVFAVVYSPDTTMIATGGLDQPRTEDNNESDSDDSDNTESSIKIWDAKTGELVATLKGHTNSVRCLAWTADGKTLISGSFDHSIRTWNAKTWKQTAVLDEHTSSVYGIAISPNGRILASASYDKTARLWNLDNGQPICSPLRHADVVICVSFSADGKLLATGCYDENAYTWDVATMLREAGLDELLLDPKANKSALRENATRHPTQRREPPRRVPQGFFDDPRERSQFSPRSRTAPQGSTFLGRLFNRSRSDAHHTSPSSPLDWAQNLFKRRGQSGEDIKLHEHSPAVVEVPCAQGQRRNASAREKRKTKPLRTTMGSSRPPKPNATQQSSGATQTQPSLQPQPNVSDSSTTPAVSDTTAASTSTTVRPHATIRHAGLWTRFWLFIGCLSPEYTDGRH